MTDLSTLATKQDLAKVESKLEAKIDSVNDKVDRLAILAVKSQADIRQLKEDMVTKEDFRKQTDIILRAIDAFAGTANDYKIKDIARKETIDIHADKLEDHEKRLTLLEN